MTLHDLKRSHRASAVGRRRIVAVVGSGTSADAEACRLVGRLVAELDCHLLTGAGGGTMKEVGRAFCGRRDELGSTTLSIGIVPGEAGTDGAYATKAGYPNRWVELAIYTHLPLTGPEGTAALSRNHINVLSADAVVALPGGAGTQSEIELAQRYGVVVIGYGGQARAGIEHATEPAHLHELLLAELSRP